MGSPTSDQVHIPSAIGKKKKLGSKVPPQFLPKQKGKGEGKGKPFKKK